MAVWASAGRQLRLGAAALAAAVCSASASPLTDPAAVHVVIGPGWAAVTETHTVRLPRGESELRLPADADLVPSSVFLRSSRDLVQLQSWQETTAADPVLADDAQIRWTPGGMPDIPRPQASPTSLRLRVNADLSGSHTLRVTYLLTNWSWAMHYELTVRGDIRNPASPISLDVEGWLDIRRAGSRRFADANVLLVGGDAEDGVAPPDPAGILALDPYSPLADAWRDPSAAPGVAHLYPVSRTLTFEPRAGLQSLLVSARRVSAERLYAIGAREIPSDIRGPGAPFTQYLVVRNDAALGEGRALPPGESVIYLGALRGGVHQRGRIRHVSPGETIRVDMGPAEGLMIKRVGLGELQSAAGYYEARWALRIENTFPVDVPVEIAEEPPLNLAWSLSASTRSYVLENQRILYAFPAPGKAGDSLEYTIRYRLPEF